METQALWNLWDPTDPAGSWKHRPALGDLEILIKKRHALWPPQCGRLQSHSFSFLSMPAGKNQDNPHLLCSPMTTSICINLHNPVPRLRRD